MKVVRVRVTGRVQGVSFRWYAQEQARGLGVVGWVRNEPDGSVVAHAEGEPDALDALVVWCRRGPIGSKVRDVAARPAAVAGHRGFEIRY